MPLLRDYNIFISHAWKYGEQYNRIIEFLDAAPNFSYRNYSAPEDNPIIPYGQYISKSQLSTHITNKISHVHVVLVLAGMYTAYSEWMQMEIEIAQGFRKPIIGIQPWGSTMTPMIITNAAKTVVGWNTDSIVSAIRVYTI